MPRTHINQRRKEVDADCRSDGCQKYCVLSFEEQVLDLLSGRLASAQCVGEGLDHEPDGAHDEVHRNDRIDAEGLSEAAKTTHLHKRGEIQSFLSFGPAPEGENELHGEESKIDPH